MIGTLRAIAVHVSVNEGNLTVALKDGGTLSLPLRLFPKFSTATPEQLRDVRITATGTGLRWGQLDEDLGVDGLMRKAERHHIEERLSSQVPADFPRDPAPASLSGAQPKLTARLIDGQFVVGLTAEERYVRWEICEGLAHQLVSKTLHDAAKHPEHSQTMTLTRVRRAVEDKHWTEPLETKWIMQRLRALLGW